MVYAKKADFEKISKDFNIDPVLARVIRNRDIISYEEIEAYLNGEIKDMHSPYLLKDMDKSINILLEKINNKKSIRIIGDYDIDGICSTYILLSGLRKAGAQVDIDIPDRIIDGYGINKNLINKAYDDGIDTILTCDNGISAVAEIEYAKMLGMTVIVTDHHNVAEILPPADAIINPKQKDCPYPFKELCGAAVAYKLIQVLFEKFGIDGEEHKKLIEYAAIATIGDVVTLLGENRIIARSGLRLINNTKNIGLKALIDVNDLTGKHIESYHIGFILGPCLNASGRLDTAKRAFSLLDEEDITKAKSIAAELKQLNTTRKDMTFQGFEDAKISYENKQLHEDKVMVIYLPDCHESLAGIIAGRLKEKYYKPVFVLTKSEDGIKGSGRSIEGYNMHAELTKIENILSKYGGHAMAAGLSMETSNLELFKELLNKNTELKEEDLIPKIWIDTELPLEYINIELVTQLRLLEPFGRGNEKPVFAAKNLTIVGTRVVGSNQNVLTLKLVTESGFKISGVCFEKDEFPDILKKSQEGRKVSMIFYPQINEYNGNKELRVTVKAVK